VRNGPAYEQRGSGLTASALVSDVSTPACTNGVCPPLRSASVAQKNKPSTMSSSNVQSIDLTKIDNQFTKIDKEHNYSVLTSRSTQWYGSREFNTSDCFFHDLFMLTLTWIMFLSINSRSIVSTWNCCRFTDSHAKSTDCTSYYINILKQVWRIISFCVIEVYLIFHSSWDKNAWRQHDFPKYT